MSITKHRVSVAIVLLFVCTVFILPVGAQDFGMTLPEPTELQVGYRLYAVVDESREEIFTELEDDVRTFPVAIYYPASPTADAVPAPYTTESENMAYNTALMIPPIVFDSIKGHLFVDAPLASRAGGYPVLMFSPGFGAPIRFYTALLTELASQGFIIAVVDHPYSQTVSLFPDDSVVTANKIGSDLASSEGLDRVLDVWVKDTQYALDYLSELNTTDSILAGAFDLAHVGAFGHSFGGATSANVSVIDDRVLASLNMDGTLFGDAAQGVSKPFMVMSAPFVSVTDEDLNAIGMTREMLEEVIAEYTNTNAGGLSSSEAPYHLVIEGTLHNTYSIDIALLRNLLPEVITPEFVGTIDGSRANEVIVAYTVAFFNKHLLGEASPLLDGESEDYPEVKFVTD